MFSEASEILWSCATYCQSANDWVPP